MTIDSDEIVHKSRLSMVRLLPAEVERIIDTKQSDSIQKSLLTSAKKTLNGTPVHTENETGVLIALTEQC